MSKLNSSKTEWILSPLYKSDGDPKMTKDRSLVEKANYQFINKWKSRSDYLTDPKVLTEAFSEYEKINRFFGSSGNLGYYFDLRTSQDQLSPDLKAKETKVQDFTKKIHNDINFFTIRIASIDPKLQSKFLKYPGLSLYKHFLEREFLNAKYLLSEPEEKILVLSSKTGFSNWVQMVSTFLSKQERAVQTAEGIKTKSFSAIQSLLSDKNKKIRDSAAGALNDILSSNLDVAVEELNSVLEYKKVNDELRGFSRADQSRHISDDIETKVVDSLIEAVSARNSIAHRYYELKAKLLGVPKLAYHERNVEILDLDLKYTYPQASELVYQVLAKLDPEFGEIFKGFVENGQIDVFPRKGKRSGAFCAADLLVNPTYILLNFSNQLRDVITIAHETGHGINDELMRQTQNSLNFSTPMSTAEVASTFMEDFVLQELIKDATPAARLSIMMSKLNDDISSIFRQVALYKCELELHRSYREKGYLSAEEIGNIFQTSMAAYMGDFVEQPDSAKNWWIYWSHIRYFFYVYSYASGLLISKSLQSSVKKDQRFILKVKDFLSAGRSDSPQVILARAGVDISKTNFWDKGLDEVEKLLGDTESLARTLGKIV